MKIQNFKQLWQCRKQQRMVLKCKIVNEPTYSLSEVKLNTEADSKSNQS
jgi:hypothetical protein